MLYSRVLAAMVVGGWLTPAIRASAQLADAPPDYGFDFVTIGAVGNTPYSGPDPTGLIAGRGGVDYEYRISRMEVTTAQWMEFVNAFAGTDGPRPGFAEFIPAFWGAAADPTYQGPGERWRLDPVLPQAANLPVGGMSWRDAAMYCNWLHNGKSPTLGALASGAYDTSTWGQGPGGTFTDAPTHQPGARYWIPTLDEWMKASNFDPNRYGQGTEGWWQYANRSDSPGIPGPPAMGTTSAGWEDPTVFNGQWQIPLGAYPQSVSPWGLLDTSGGASEWNEDYLSPLDRSFRLHDGAPAGVGNELLDSLRFPGGQLPPARIGAIGLRLASTIPEPTVLAPLVLVGVHFARRQRHEQKCADQSRRRCCGLVSPNGSCSGCSAV